MHSSGADGWPLRVSVNGYSGRSFHLVVPNGIDTLAELCHFLTEEIPLPPGPSATTSSASASRRFRFLYTTAGVPLWRVPECRELGVIVASERAGFVSYGTEAGAARPPSPTFFTSQGSSSGPHTPYGSGVRRSESSPAPSRPTQSVPLQSSPDDEGDAEVAGFINSSLLLRPSFASLHTSPATEEWTSMSCELLLARKWRAFQQIRHREDLLARKEVQRRVDAVFKERRGTTPGAPLRLVVTGPPGSGVSTIAAMLLHEVLQNSSMLRGLLVVVMDMPLLLFEEAEEEVPPVYVWCELVLRAVADAVASGRRSMQLSSADITEYWMSIIWPLASTVNPSTRNALTSALGEDVMREWETAAAEVAAVLQASLANPAHAKRRQDGMYIIFRGIPAVMARTMGFTGLLIVIENVEVIGGGVSVSPKRGAPSPVAHEDLTAVLHALVDTDRTPNIHCLLASSAASQPLAAAYLPALTAWIKTVGLIDTRAVADLPQHVHCFTDIFDVGIFLGSPGYLAAFYQHGLIKGSRREEDHVGAISSPTCLRIDDSQVQAALRSLEKLAGVIAGISKV